MPGRRLHWALAALAAALIAPAPAVAVTGPQAVAALNGQRAANGLPGNVVEDSGWSAACAKHVAYMRATGTLTHVESASSPYYTSEGAWAGMNAVLGAGEQTPWGRNPWIDAPIHLHQLLQPGLVRTGWADAAGWTCMTTWPGVDDAVGRGQVYTFPGNGVTGVPTSLDASSEGPTNPAEQVGLGRTAITGPNLLVWAPGLSPALSAPVLVQSATLTGPGGAVEVRWMDNGGPYGAYLARGAILVPVRPLQPGATYTATVALRTADGGSASRTWTFTTAGTGGSPPPPPPPPTGRANQVTLALDRTQAREGEAVGASGSSTAANPTLTATRGGEVRSFSLPARAGAYGVTLSLPAGTWDVCVASGGSPTLYAVARRCVTLTVASPAVAAPPGPPPATAGGPPAAAATAAVRPDRVAPRVRAVKVWIRRAGKARVLHVEATLTDDRGGVPACSYRLASNAWRACRPARNGRVRLALRVALRGRPTVRLRARDVAGNVKVVTVLTAHR